MSIRESPLTVMRRPFHLHARHGLQTMGRRHPYAPDRPMTISFAHIQRIRAALAATVIGCALAACASLPPPTGELQGAQQAVSRADQADADQHAPDLIAAARSELSRAQDAMARGDEDMARRFALSAAADADLANARSREAAQNNELAQRRAEIAELRNRLQMGDGQ